MLDDTQSQAEFEIHSQQLVLMQATEARLLAELTGRAIGFPADLLQRHNDPFVRTAIEGQLNEFESRRIAIEGQEQVLKKRIAQLEWQRGPEGGLSGRSSLS